MSKRKRVVLNFQQKLEILNQLNEGKSGSVLAKEYGIGTSTISDLRRNGAAILQFVSNLECGEHISEKKTRKTVQNTNLDSRVYQWYKEEKLKGNFPLDAAICAKALVINSQLKGNENFKASAGWLRHFKNRHGIKEVKEQSEELSGVSVGRQFRNVFKRGGYILENVYSADDCFLQWKSLPGCDNKGESFVSVIACTNANASHKLPLYVLGRDKKPQTNSDTIIYKPYHNEFSFFNEWFEDIFIPEVKKRQQLTGSVGKVLLVIDDASWHPSRDSLIKNRDDFDVFIISENFPEVHPLQYGIKRLTTIYRKKLLNLLTIKSSYSIKQFLEEFTINESISAIGEAWDSVPRTHIVQLWGRLFPNMKNDKNWMDSIEIQDSREILNLTQNIKELQQYNLEDIKNWLDCDKISNLKLPVEDNIKIEVTTNNLETDDYLDDSHKASIKIEPGPSDMEAYDSLTTIIDWCSRQSECTHEQLSNLEYLRNLAASKMYEIKQEY